MHIVCQTPRLLLRRFTLDDVEPLARIHRDPEVCRFIGGVKTIEQTQSRIEEFLTHYDRYEFGKWAVILLATGQLIGRCGPMCVHIDGVTEIEIGYTYDRGHWGHGYATEGALAVLKYCRDILGEHRLISLIHPDNLASARVAGRIGMQYERITTWNGTPTHLYSYTNEKKKIPHDHSAQGVLDT